MRTRKLGMMANLLACFSGLMFSVAWFGQSAAPVVAATTFSVVGTVRNNDGAPVLGVQVFAFSGPTQFKTFTDASGAFALTLDASTYDIVFNPAIGSGLASQSVRGVFQAQTLAITLPPGHAISGTLYRDTPARAIVPNVAIFAFNIRTFQGFGLPPSDSVGAYRIALESGSWELTFTPPPFSDLGPARTTVISFTADLTSDLTLPPGFTLFGGIIERSGQQPVAGVEIFAQSPGAPAGYGFTPTDASGAYAGTLTMGSYDVLFTAPPFRGLGSTVVTNAGGPPDQRIDLVLPAGFTLSGAVRCGVGIANAFVLAIPRPPLSAGSFAGWGRFAGTDGAYALALQPGVYDIEISPPGGAFHKRTIHSLALQTDTLLNVDFCLMLPLITR